MSTFNAEGLIAQAEAYGRQRFPGPTDEDGRYRLALTVGAMSADIRNLCALIELQRTPAGIVTAIAVMPSSHRSLLAVIQALHARIELEVARSNDDGYRDVEEHLGDAVEAMDRAFARVVS